MSFFILFFNPVSMLWASAPLLADFCHSGSPAQTFSEYLLLKKHNMFFFNFFELSFTQTAFESNLCIHIYIFQCVDHQLPNGSDVNYPYQYFTIYYLLYWISTVSGSVHFGILTLHLFITVGFLRWYLKQLPVSSAVGKLKCFSGVIITYGSLKYL